MSENENHVPIKEREDGTIIAKVELPEEIEDGIEGSEDGKKKKKKKDKDRDSSGDNSDNFDDSGSGDSSDDTESHEEVDENDEEREKIREARREERRLKKELKRQRDLTSRNKIQSLERHNEQLMQRLAALENTAASYQFAQIDKAVEDEATRVEYTKMKMMEAAQNGNAAAQVEYLEQLTDAKQRLNQLQHYKKQQIEAAKAPKQNVPTPINTEVQSNATKWLKKNSWYDPQARDTDSRIAKIVDQELANDGWDPADPEYWDELDSRLSSRLPHRYTAKGNNAKKHRANPTPSARSESASTAKPGTITLSRDRVQAIKDAGAWDDVDKRNKMIRAYAQYDRQNKG
jgi:hypothetical protein